MSNIVVVGSINMDIVTRTQRFPKPGETLQALDTSFYPGGKGANQAVAAARSGMRVGMVGAVGDDPFGQVLLKHLSHDGIDISSMSVYSNASTGVASITVDEHGSNYILVASGANLQFRMEESFGTSVWSDCKYVLLQNEIDPKTNLEVIQYCKPLEIQVIYNPAPITKNMIQVIQDIDILILNEVEAAEMSGYPVKSKEDAVLVASSFIQRGCGKIVLTLGGDGCIYSDGKSILHMPAAVVNATDTTAAGDTFIGAFVAALAMDKKLTEALQYATAAAALSVTKRGAQSSIPHFLEVNQFLLQNDLNLNDLSMI